MGSLLNETDKSGVEAFARHGSTPSIRRRAQLLMLYDEGLQTKEVAGRVGLSPSQTRHWRHRYLMHGIEIFAEEKPHSSPPSGTVTSEDVLAESGSGIEAEDPDFRSQLAAEDGGEERDEAAGYPVNLRQAEHRRDLALALFDGTQNVHQLQGDQRRLLEVAALRQYLAESQLSDQQDKAGRLFILSHPLADLDPDEQKIVETILEHQQGGNKRYSGDRLAAELSASDRDALLLAGLLRIAESLDASGSQETRIGSAESRPTELHIQIEGPQAGKDARAARKRARLWSALTDQAVRIQVSRTGRIPRVAGSVEDLLAKKSPGVEPADSLAEAGRKVFGFHFAEMLRHEEGTRSGEDIEELHDMRVATRRMRAAFEVFGGSYESKAIKAHLKGLRATGRALGRVRDLDVFMEKARQYLETLPEEQRAGLDPLLQGWQQEREKDREEMLAHLDSANYASFKRKFQTFLTTPGAGAHQAGPTDPDRVRDIVPSLVYTRLGAVRAFGTILDSATIEQLHALRIEFKKLRYTLEFFREVLGGEAKALIEGIKNLQDHLGDLNDADVACHILREFLDAWENRQLMIPIDERDNPEPIVAYLATRHAERHRLIVTFREAWSHFDRAEVRAQFAAAVAVL